MKKLLCALSLAVATVGSVFSGTLPAGYTPVEYIESTGAQTIDPIYTTTSNTVFVLDAARVGSNDGLVLGCSWGWQSADCMLSILWSGWVYYRTTSAMSTSTDPFRFTISIPKGTCVGTNLTTKAVVSRSASKWKDAGKAIRAFGSNGSDMSKVKVYGLLIYEEGLLVRDFRPCKNATGLTGLYDTVNGVFYPSTYGSTPFTAGPVGGKDTLVVKGSPQEYGTPSGSVSGYGFFGLTDGQTVTCTMPETSVSEATGDATLLGWTLEVKTNGVTTTTTSTPATLTTCSFVHRAGGQETLTWNWQPTKHRISVTADPGLTVTCDKTEFPVGQTVTFTASVQESGDRFVAWSGAVPGDKVFFTNLTMTVSQGVAIKAMAPSQRIYAAAQAAGTGDGSSWADAMALQPAIEAARLKSYSMICLKSGLYPVTAQYSIGTCTGPILLSGGYSGSGLTKSGVTTLARSSGSTRVLYGGAATFSAEGLVISNGCVSAGTTGHGVGLASSCVASFRDCVFQANGLTGASYRSTHNGGAIGASGGTLIVQNCRFNKNRIEGQTLQDGGGAAIYASGASLYVSDSLFATNYVGGKFDYGAKGAVLNVASAPKAEIANCTFLGNYTWCESTTSSPRGGVLYFGSCADVTVRDSRFDGNYSSWFNSSSPRYPFGGTLLANSSTVRVLRTVVTRGGNNSGTYACGGIDTIGGTLALTNVLFANSYAGWAIGNNGGRVLAKNCTFAGMQKHGWASRKAAAYTATYTDGAASAATASFDDCVFWNNADGDLDVADSQMPSFAYCLTETKRSGLGNVSADPLFDDATYYHPKSSAGNYAGGYFAGGSWMTTNTVTSPAIDLGGTFAALATEPQPNGCRLNAGYDGNTSVASKSVVADPPVIDPTALGVVAYDYVALSEGITIFHGDVTGAGTDPVAVKFVWGDEDGGTASVDDWDHVVACGSHLPWDGVVAQISGSLSGKVYYRFVVADGTADAKWSNPVRLYAVAEPPTLAYAAPAFTHVYRTSARVNLVLFDGSADTTVSVTYQVSDGSSDPVTVEAEGGAAIPSGNVAVDLTGLAAGTQYTVTATARNSAAEVTTDERTFTTPNQVSLKVGPAATGAGDGSGWSDVTTLGAAIAVATGANDEICVQKGAYFVNENVSGTALANRHLTIRGGFGTDGTPDAGETLFTATNATQKTGRHFKLTGCTVVFDGITFSNGRNNADSYGQSIGTFSATSLTVTNCIFRNNGDAGIGNITSYGGAIGASGGTLTVLDSTFVGNSLYGSDTGSPYGGAIGANGSATVTVRGSTFVSNRTQLKFGRLSGGGAIYAGGCASLSVESCHFATNHTENTTLWDMSTDKSSYGGTIFVSSTPTVLRDIKVVGSWAYTGDNARGTGWDWGGTFCFVGSTVTGENIEIRGTGQQNNTAVSGSVTVRSGTVSLTNVLFAAVQRGSCLSQSGGTLTVVNGTFADAKKLGTLPGAAYSQYTGSATATANFRNCIVWDNASGFRGSFTNEAFTVNVSYSDIQGETPDPERHILSADPRFKDAAAGDYTLRKRSPCINAGDTTGFTQTDVDLAGNLRVRNGQVDLGCYECEKKGLAILVK